MGLMEAHMGPPRRDVIPRTCGITIQCQDKYMIAEPMVLELIVCDPDRFDQAQIFIVSQHIASC